MSFLSQIEAMLAGKPVDRVPYMCLESVMPRGQIELSLRQRGMGLCLQRPVVWCAYPHVNVEVRGDGDITTLVYHTPAGDLTIRSREHLGRLRSDASSDLDGLVKLPEDLEAATAMIADAEYHVDTNAYSDTAFEIGADGLVSGEGPQPPYETSCALAGYRAGMVNAHQTLTNWHFLQRANPAGFEALLVALAAQEERRLQAVLASPLRLVSLGRVDGQMGPERWRERVLPFYQKVVPQLQAAGKVCMLHAHAPDLSAFAALIAETGVDIVEGLTPPPRGNLAVEEARQAWGSRIILWVNVPESLFWRGAPWVGDYVRGLVSAGAPRDRLIIGHTEEGLTGLVDDESDAVHAAGYHAIMDALGYPR